MRAILDSGTSRARKDGFEALTGPDACGHQYEAYLSGVTELGVKTVMDVFFRAYGGSAAGRKAPRRHTRIGTAPAGTGSLARTRCASRSCSTAFATGARQ